MKNKHKYSDKWNDVIRPAILLRDGYKCKFDGCNVRHKAVGYYNPSGQFVECDTFMCNWAINNGFKIQKVSLQVAHLDGNTQNNSPENLKSFCPKHHFAYDLQENLLKRSKKVKLNS